MKHKLLLIVISVIFIVVICVSYNGIKNYNVKNIISPNIIQINKVDFVDNKFFFSGYIIGNSFYGDYTGYKYMVKGKKLYIILYSNDLLTSINDDIEIEIIDDKLYDVKEVFVKQGTLLRSIATR